MKHAFGDAADAPFMAHNPLDDEDSASLRRRLATRAEFSDLSRMSDAQVRAQLAALDATGRLAQPHTGAPEVAHPDVQPARKEQIETAVPVSAPVPEDAITRLNVPTHFAPGAEHCAIQYGFQRRVPGSRVSLVIRDRDNNVIKRDDTLGGGADRDDVFNWDGKDTGGRLVGPDKSPFHVTLELASGLSQVRDLKVEISSIVITNQEGPNLVMNDPDHKFVSEAAITLKKTDNTAAACAVPCKVEFSYVDPPPDNTAKATSFSTRGGVRVSGATTRAGVNLGKRAAPPSEVFWEAHADCTAASADGFKEKCKVDSVTASGANQGKAKIWFKPSGVGGDTFKIKATVYASDGTTVLKTVESAQLTVWRRVSFTAYEMVGQTHISTYGSNAVMSGYYTADMYVEYLLGTVNAIAAQFSVTYVGLWDHAAMAQKDWATWQAKTPTETPTATEIRDAKGPAGPARNRARAAVQAKANAWRDRINTQYNDALRHWATDAGVPANSVVAAGYEHPKYSADAPDADSETAEWTDCPWLKIEVEGDDVRPDDRWVYGQGLSYGNRAYILAGPGAARMKVVIAHEAGHETKNQFERADFGGGDHSASAGLMDPTGSLASFTQAEKNKLRGIA